MNNRKDDALIIDISTFSTIDKTTGIQRVVKELSKTILDNQKKIKIYFIDTHKLKISETFISSDNNDLNSAVNFPQNHFLGYFKILTFQLFSTLISLLKLFFFHIPLRFLNFIISFFSIDKQYQFKAIFHFIYILLKLMPKLFFIKKYNVTYLLLDSSWTPSTLALSFFFKFTRNRVISVFYDLSPMKYPNFFNEKFVNNFNCFWRYQLYLSDNIYSISKSVSSELSIFLKKNNFFEKSFSPLILSVLRKLSNFSDENFFNYFLLGNDLSINKINLNIVRNKKKYLVVGSIEPRKDVDYIVTQFEYLWSKNIDVSLSILYSNTWNSEDFLKKLKKHKELNNNLFLIYGANDRELICNYHDSYALINASIYEGYGLNIAEALSYGCKVFSNDIDVVREVYGDSVTYFNKKEIHLHELIENDIYSPYLTKKYFPISWKKASELLLEKIYKSI